MICNQEYRSRAVPDTEGTGYGRYRIRVVPGPGGTRYGGYRIRRVTGSGWYRKLYWCGWNKR